MRQNRAVPSRRLLAGLALGVALLAGAGHAAAYTRNAEDDASDIEKQVQRINESLMALQDQEFSLTMQISQAQQKAQALIKNPGNASKELARGKRSPALLKYKAVLIASARRLQQFDRRLAPLMKQAEALQRKRDQAGETVQAMIDSVTATLQGKHRTNLEKIGNLYEQAAEWRPALAAYLQVYSSIPKTQQTKNPDLVKTIADLYDKVGNPKQALSLFNQLFEKRKPEKRYKDTELAERVADLHAKTGKPQTALEMYRKLYEHIPEDKKHERDRKRVRKKIDEVKRSGRR